MVDALKLKKTEIIAVAARSTNYVIGKNGKMPWPKLPADLQRFKKITVGHPVIMGWKTWDSLGDYKPLPNRPNIVMTRNTDRTHVQRAHIAHSKEEALEIALHFQPEKIAIIGGGEIYKLFANLIDTLHLTVINKAYDGDTFFPESIEDKFSHLIKRERRQDSGFLLDFRTLK